MDIKFLFRLDQKVKVERIGFSGVVTMCAIQGDPKNPEIVYYISGATAKDWYAERLLTSVEE